MTKKKIFNPSWSAELNELLTAAVVNQAFQQLLLQETHRALREGYNGRAVVLTPAERMRVLRIEAETLADFVAQLSELWSESPPKQNTHGRGGTQSEQTTLFLAMLQDIHGRD